MRRPPPLPPIRVAAPGWTLAVHPHPAQPETSVRGVVLLVHAMLADATYLVRLAERLSKLGFHCYRLDHRGHGASGPLPPAGDWSFDDLVRHDQPVVVEHLRLRHPGLPVWLVGHSLGGMVGLAAQATVGPLYDGIVCIASGLWGYDEGRRLRLARLALMHGTLALAAAMGRVPGTRFGMTADESVGYWRQLAGFCRRRRWQSVDGLDYRGAVSLLRLPVFGLLGEDDALVRPEDHGALLCMSGVQLHTVPRADHFSVMARGWKVVADILVEAMPADAR